MVIIYFKSLYWLVFGGKICEPLGLAINLKVKLESFYPVGLTFYSKNRDRLKSDLQNTFMEVYHCTNKRRYLRTSERVVEAQQAENGYKRISEVCGLHQSTVRQVEET